jgi:hypothetical protein
MTEQPLSISRLCDKQPERREHSVIWAANRDLPRCGYCGHRWPQEVPVESDNEAISASDLRQSSSSSLQRSSPSIAGYVSSGRPLLDLSRSRSSPSSSSSSSRGRTANLRQFAHFDQMRQQANEATRAAKEASPFNNPAGLKIRLKPLYSIGTNLPGSSLFKASKTTQLSVPSYMPLRLILAYNRIDSLNLPLIPWITLKSTSKADFISNYIKRFMNHHTIDDTNIQFGVAFEKTPRADTGIFTSIAVEHEPFDSLGDVFNEDTASEWAVEDGRVVLWVEIQYVMAAEDHQKAPKSRHQKAPKASRKASIEAIKVEPLSGVINLDAFPPDRSIEALNDTTDWQEEELQLDHEEAQEDREELHQ